VEDKRERQAKHDGVKTALVLLVKRGEVSINFHYCKVARNEKDYAFEAEGETERQFDRTINFRHFSKLIGNR